MQVLRYLTIRAEHETDIQHDATLFKNSENYT